MNQSESRTIRYAVAGLCGLLLLTFIGWLVLREPPPSSDQQQPAKVVTAAPHARHVAPQFMPDDDAQRETVTNQVAEPATTNANAAAIYQQAFAIYDALSKEQKDLIGNWRTNVDSSVAAELCEKIQPICDLMHQAAAISNCDWGVEQPITSTTRLPHLSPCRNLGRAAIWSVAHCRTGNPAAAIDDLVAASRVGQNVSSSAPIGYWVDLAIQGMVIDSVAEHASRLAGAGDTRLVELFSDANYDEGLRHAIEQETDIAACEADRLATEPPEKVAHVLEELGSFADGTPRFQSLEPAEAIADLRQAIELQRQFAKAQALPEADYREWLASLEAIRKTNPFADLLLSPMEIEVNRTKAMTVRSAMAAAGLAVMQNGTDALQSHPDPATGQPFAYTQTADGFELESGFQFQEKPVKLSFK